MTATRTPKGSQRAAVEACILYTNRTIKDIAQQFECTQVSVKDIAKDLGIDLQVRSREIQSRRAKGEEFDPVELVKMLREKRLSKILIAKIIGISENKLNKLMSVHGISGKLSDEEENEIKRVVYRVLGVNCSHIAFFFINKFLPKATQSDIRTLRQRWSKENGVYISAPKEGRSEVWITAEKLLILGWTLEEVYCLLGIGKNHLASMEARVRSEMGNLEVLRKDLHEYM